MTAAADWTALAPPLALPPGIADEPDDRPSEESTAPICPVCNEPIIRDPSWKRMRKYHPECAPNANKGSTGSTNTPSGSGFTRKAEKEAEECEKILQSAFMKLALCVSVIDRYDAFCIMVNTPAVCSSFRGVCLRYEPFRKEMLAVKTGGSLAGFVMSLAFMVAPIFAHHGLIPSKRVAEAMTRLPYILFTLHQRMKEGEEALTILMREQMAEMRKERERQERAAQAQRAESNGHVPTS